MTARMIYLTDNGRALCRDHLGASARMTGRDLSGQRILALTPEDIDYCIQIEGWHPSCETCHIAAPVGGLTR